MRLYNARGQDKAITPLYLVQTDAERFWTRHEFIDGHNIIGVRFAGPSFVYLPHDLPQERVITIKDEAGVGPTTVRIYEA